MPTAVCWFCPVIKQSTLNCYMMYTFAKLLLSELPPWLLHLISLCFYFLHYSSQIHAVLPVLPVSIYVQLPILFPAFLHVMLWSQAPWFQIISGHHMCSMNDIMFRKGSFCDNHSTIRPHITNSVEQSLSEPDFSSASQICCMLWNPKVPHHAHSSLPPFHVWARWIQFTPWHHIYLWSILVVSLQL
jgi:hypothetical protein